MPEPASASAESTSRAPPAYRLVIRAQIIPDPIPGTAEPPSNRRAFALLATLVVVLGLGWAGFIAYRTDPVTPRATTSAPAPAPQNPAAVEPTHTPLSSIEPDTPLRPVEQVTPAASPRALKTIRGTIRVATKVTIDQQGRVIDAVATEPGPSRYFERVSLDASRQWTFTPSSADTSRSMLLRFNFTRSGVTASSEGAAY